MKKLKATICTLEYEIIISIKNQVIPFLNNIILPKDFWSLNDGWYNAIEIASKFFLRCFCEGAVHKIFHLNTWSVFLLMCSAGSDLWSGLLCLDQRVTDCFSYCFTYIIISALFTFSIIYLTRWIYLWFYIAILFFLFSK